MLPETHPLIEAVTKPLANNAEQRLAAVALLEEHFDESHPAIPEALERLGKARSKTSSVLWFLLRLAAVLMLAGAVIHVYPVYQLADSYIEASVFLPSDPPPLPATLTREQRLLFPDSDITDLDRLKLLTETAPENPAYYSEYAAIYYNEHNALPPDYFETVGRIAPENSYFLYYAAGRIGGNSVEGKLEKDRVRPPERYENGVRLGPLPTDRNFEILDEKAFSEALDLIEKAARLPDFETYSNRMTRERVNLLPDGTLAEWIGYQSYAWGGAAGYISFRKIADILATRAQILASEGRGEEFLTLVETHNHLAGGLANNPDSTFVGELVNQLVISSNAQYLRTAARTLGFEELARTFQKQMDAVQRERDLKQMRERSFNQTALEANGSNLVAEYLPLIENHSSTRQAIPDSDLRPLRMVDHEVATRFGLVLVALSSFSRPYRFTSLASSRHRPSATLRDFSPGCCEGATGHGS